jgi:hypothetical protein
VSRHVPPSLHVLVVVLLVVLVSIFLGPRIYVDRTILVGDAFYYDDPSFRIVAEQIYTTRPKNRLTHIDNAYYIYPHLHYVQTTLDTGEFPWWNPYAGLGVPEVGINAGALEPVALALGRVLSVPMLVNVRAVAALVLGGWGTFLLVTTLGASRSAAVFAAVAFSFSGWTIAWLGRTNLMAEIWMPWLFWATERLLRQGGISRVGAVAFFTAPAFLTGHPQTSVQILAALAIYVAARLVSSAEPVAARARRGGLVTAAVVLGIAVALVQLVPMLEMVSLSQLPPTGRGRVREAAGILGAVWNSITGDPVVLKRDLPTLVTAVAPTFFGSPVTGSWWWAGYNGMEMMVYAGLLPPFFAAYAAAARRESPGIGIWLLLSVIALGAAYAVPILNALNYVPVLGLANNGRLRMVFRFALVVAAAFGVDRFAQDVRDGRVRWARWLAGFGVVVTGAPALTYLGLRATGHALPPAATVAAGGAGAVIVLIALAGLVCLYARAMLGRIALAGSLVALAFADAVWHLGDFNPAIPTMHVFPETPAVRFLRSDPSLYRVSSSPYFRVLPPHAKLPYRLYDADLFDVLLLRRYATLQEAANGYPAHPDNTLHVFNLRHPDRIRGLVNLLNVKYVLVPRLKDNVVNPFQDRPWYRLVYEHEMRIYENLEVLPRAFLVGRALVTTADGALAAMTRPDFDPRTAVLLEDVASPRLPEPPAGGPGSATVTATTANTVTVVADATSPAYLVLSDTFYPGWRAFIGGRETSIYRANYLFRAVYVPAGRHEIVFTFMPRSYRLAVLGTLLALAGVLACLAGPPMVCALGRRTGN